MNGGGEELNGCDEDDANYGRVDAVEESPDVLVLDLEVRGERSVGRLQE